MTHLINSAQAYFLEALRHYHQAILWIERNGPADDRLFYINAGLAVWLITAFLRHRSWANSRNLIPLAILEGLNESANYLFLSRWTLTGMLADVFWTFLWPVLLILTIGWESKGNQRRR